MKGGCLQSSVSKDSLKDVFTHDVLKEAVCQPGELGCIHSHVHHKAAYQTEVKGSSDREMLKGCLSGRLEAGNYGVNKTPAETVH
jgi:hypothetical protein